MKHKSDPITEEVEESLTKLRMSTLPDVPVGSPRPKKTRMERLKEKQMLANTPEREQEVLSSLVQQSKDPYFTKK